MFYHGGIFAKQNLCVECFFFVSGAFLAKSLDSDHGAHQKEPPISVCIESWRFVLQRACKLYPAFLISTLFGLVIRLIATANLDDLICFGGDLLFLQNYAFPVGSYTQVLWLYFALAFGLWLIYPIEYRHHDVFVKYLVPVLYVFITGYLSHRYSSMGVPDSFNDMINTGFLWSICALSSGAAIYDI